MRVFSECVETGVIVEITHEPAAAGVVRGILAYVDTARSYGLRDCEIEEDIGGGGHDTMAPFDGFVTWAVGAEIRCGDLYLGDSGVFVSQD